MLTPDVSRVTIFRVGDVILDSRNCELLGSRPGVLGIHVDDICRSCRTGCTAVDPVVHSRSHERPCSL